jgi:hypothetical protein
MKKKIEARGLKLLSERTELLSVLAELSEIHPEMRLGQLVTNVAHCAKGPVVSAAWDASDQELIQAAKANIQRKRSEKN